MCTASANGRCAARKVNVSDTAEALQMHETIQEYVTFVAWSEGSRTRFIHTNVRPTYSGHLKVRYVRQR